MKKKSVLEMTDMPFQMNSKASFIHLKVWEGESVGDLHRLKA